MSAYGYYPFMCRNRHVEIGFNSADGQCPLCGAIAERDHERRIWCDQPEDRLYHAKDKTWWKRDANNRCVRADPPPGFVRRRDD
jgi:hypothetical protein